MDVVFSNPAGWWALLGLPAILAIHFLQRQSRRVVTSTLFLLDQLEPVSAQGRRIERLRSSIPLWLQLLAVLLIAWLLAQPRWLRSDSTQTVVVVLDSSVSMEVWQEPVKAGLATRLEALSKAAAHTDWVLLESDLKKPTLYSGPELPRMLEQITAWKPTLGTHDPAPALRLAGNLVPKAEGVVIYATDHAQEVPEGVRVFATGLPIDNVGFIGLRMEGDQWVALVKNHGSKRQTRFWHVESGGQAGPTQQITLDPGQSEVLRGRAPPLGAKMELVLDADLFPIDDRMPILREQPKVLTAAYQAGTPHEAFFQRLLDSLPRVTKTEGGSADLKLLRYNPLAPAPVAPGSIVLLADVAPAKSYLNGAMVSSSSPLVAGLNWQGLLVRDTLTMPSRPEDEVLLWMEDRPLIWLRPTGGLPALVVNFDVRQSNADRLPAFVILLNRFVESLRKEKVAAESRNVETGQELAVATKPGGGAATMKPQGEPVASVLRAPARPGFFEVAQDGIPLLTAAAHFADPREADFSAAATIDTTDGVAREQALRSSREDFLSPIWTLLLGTVLVASWAFVGKSGKERES